MSPTVAIVVIIFLVVGVVFGWHSQKAAAAHGDVKVAKNRLRGGRKTRLRSGIWVVVVIAITALGVFDVIR
jgi:heme/copper-type cytochrome/quinol oxidase subunit 2